MPPPGTTQKLWTEECIPLGATKHNGLPANVKNAFTYRCVDQPGFDTQVLVADRYYNSTVCGGIVSERLTYPVNTSADGYGFDLTDFSKRFYYAGCPSN